MEQIADKNWTHEEARAAHEKAVSENPSLEKSPVSPLYQWGALQTLTWLEGVFVQNPGDSTLLFRAIALCCQHNLPIPGKFSQVFVKGVAKVEDYETGSWDEAFGKPYLGKHFDSLRDSRKGRAVWERITKLRSQPNPRSLNRALYAEIGAEFGIGCRTCKELYEEYREIAKVVPLFRNRQRLATSVREARKAARERAKGFPPDISKLGGSTGSKEMPSLKSAKRQPKR